KPPAPPTSRAGGFPVSNFAVPVYDELKFNEDSSNVVPGCPEIPTCPPLPSFPPCPPCPTTTTTTTTAKPPPKFNKPGFPSLNFEIPTCLSLPSIPTCLPCPRVKPPSIPTFNEEGIPVPNFTLPVYDEWRFHEDFTNADNTTQMYNSQFTISFDDLLTKTRKMRK
ncbi:hypothetical protein PV326_014037, partial [Microctonus aethiopoides]